MSGTEFEKEKDKALVSISRYPVCNSLSEIEFKEAIRMREAVSADDRLAELARAVTVLSWRIDRMVAAFNDLEKGVFTELQKLNGKLAELGGALDRR